MMAKSVVPTDRENLDCYREVLHPGKLIRTRFAEPIRASGQVYRIKRPDT